MRNFAFHTPFFIAVCRDDTGLRHIALFDGKRNELISRTKTPKFLSGYTDADLIFDDFAAQVLIQDSPIETISINVAINGLIADAERALSLKPACDLIRTPCALQVVSNPYFSLRSQNG